MNEFENEKNNSNEEIDEIIETTETDESAETTEPDEVAETDETNETCETTETVGMAEEGEVEFTGKSNVVKEIVSWILCIVIAISAAFVLREHVFTMVRVDGNSMYPTLQHNERLFTRIIAYTPERGDIIIFHPKHNPKTAYVKRVIATGGDRIWIDEENGDVHLLKKGSDTWEILDEPYINEKVLPGNAGIAQKYADDSGELGLLVKEGHVFAMGDNRNHSCDSRDGVRVGQISHESIVGKAIFRWWPISEFGSIYPSDSQEAKTFRTVGICIVAFLVLLVGFSVTKKILKKKQ